ncbi:hypothetical protein Tco_0017734 [Tanacetum coccineum]
MEVFKEIFQICPRLSNQEFDALPSYEETISFIKELGHKGDIKSITDVVVDQMYQPWRTFSSIINKCLSGKITDFTFQIENRNTKKQEKMYYPRFTKAIIHHFITKDNSISMRNRMFMHTPKDDSILGPMRFVSKANDYQVYGALLPKVMTNQKMRDSPAYKTYLGFATSATYPKKVRKFKKPASPSRKRTLVTIEEEEPEPAKKKKAPATTDKSKGIDLSYEAALLEEAQPNGKFGDRNKGTGLKPRVPDVSKADSSESEYKSWGDSGDEANVPGDDEDVQESDDDLQQANDERTDSENQMINDEDEESKDAFVHTPEDYVPTDDETNDRTKDVDEEEYERISEELHADVNVRLTYAEQKDEGEEDAEQAQIATTKLPLVSSSHSVSSTFTNVMLNLENLNAGKTEAILLLDITVQHEAPRTSPLLTILVSVIPEQSVFNPSNTVTTAPAPTISLLLSSLYPSLQQITPIPTPTTTEATTSTITVPESETLSTIY